MTFNVITGRFIGKKLNKARLKAKIGNIPSYMVWELLINKFFWS